MKTQDSPEYMRRVSLLRYAYLLFALIPLLYAGATVVHILMTPNPSGFASAFELFRDLFSNFLAVMVRLIINYVLFLVLCGIGYVAFSRQLLLKRNSTMVMLCLSLAIGIILHLSIYGIDALQTIYSMAGISVPGDGSVLWGLLQPQFLLAMGTAIVLLVFYLRKTARFKAISST